VRNVLTSFEGRFAGCMLLFCADPHALPSIQSYQSEARPEGAPVHTIVDCERWQQHWGITAKHAIKWDTVLFLVVPVLAVHTSPLLQTRLKKVFTTCVILVALQSFVLMSVSFATRIIASLDLPVCC
jgi:hypothetical protein